VPTHFRATMQISPGKAQGVVMVGILLGAVIGIVWMLSMAG